MKGLLTPSAVVMLLAITVACQREEEAAIADGSTSTVEASAAGGLSPEQALEALHGTWWNKRDPVPLDTGARIIFRRDGTFFYMDDSQKIGETPIMVQVQGQFTVQSLAQLKKDWDVQGPYVVLSITEAVCMPFNGPRVPADQLPDAEALKGKSVIYRLDFQESDNKRLHFGTSRMDSDQNRFIWRSYGFFQISDKDIGPSPPSR